TFRCFRNRSAGTICWRYSSRKMVGTEGRRGALIFTGLLIVGSLMGWLFWPEPTPRSWLGGAAAELALFTILFATDPRRERLTNQLILLGVAIAAAQIWISNDVAMRSSALFR